MNESMEIYAYPRHSLPPSSSASASASAAESCFLGSLVNKIKEFVRFAVSAAVGNVFSAILTFFFALAEERYLFFVCLLNIIVLKELSAVGTLLGAMTGALIGQETESGFVRGASVGAISGAVFSLQVFESSLLLWQSEESGIQCVLYLIEVIASLLSGRLVREQIGPAMLSAVQSQMLAIEATFEESPNIFDMGGTHGLLEETVKNIPKMRITVDDIADTSGEGVSCSVCLQDFQIGETVRSLPHCHHLFHLPCIDAWLLRHGSCPLCRRDL